MRLARWQVTRRCCRDGERRGSKVAVAARLWTLAGTTSSYSFVSVVGRDFVDGAGTRE